jgi:hypothetical protein
MELVSFEIDRQLFRKQMSLYMKIDNLINSRFNEFDPDMLSVLTRTLMDLDDKIQIYNEIRRYLISGDISFHIKEKP